MIPNIDGNDTLFNSHTGYEIYNDGNETLFFSILGMILNIDGNDTLFNSHTGYEIDH